MVVGFNFGFGGTKTTRNVNMGFDSDLVEKCSKQLEYNAAGKEPEHRKLPHVELAKPVHAEAEKVFNE